MSILPPWRGLRSVCLQGAATSCTPHLHRAPASTLSGIHNGLRRSGRSPSSATDRPHRTPDSNTSGRRDSFSPSGPQRGRTARDSGQDAKPQTRKSRFNDPASSFGKQSHVYQLQHSDFAEQLKGAVSRETSTSPRSQGFMRDLPKDDMPTRRRGGLRMRDLPERSPRHSLDSFSRGYNNRDGSRPRDDNRSTFPRMDTRDMPFTKDTSNATAGQRSWRDSGHVPHRLQRSEEAVTERPEYNQLRHGHVQGEQSSHDNNAYDKTFPRHSRSPLPIPRATAASQFVYGKSMVRAALSMRRRKFYKLYIQRSDTENDFHQKAIFHLAKDQGVTTTSIGVTGTALMDKMSEGRPHNGFVLEASPLPVQPITGLGAVTRRGMGIVLDAQSREEREVNGNDTFIEIKELVSSESKPLVVLLDQIQDPGNLGAIIRSASYLGANMIAVTKVGCAPLSAVALKAAAGATEVIPIVSVAASGEFLDASQKAGWKVYAAVPPRPDRKGRMSSDVVNPITTLMLEQSNPLAKDPCILVIGGEGPGLSRVLRSQADVEVAIPNHSISASIVDSLNVSVATGILCSAFVRGRETSQPSILSNVPKDAGAVF